MVFRKSLVISDECKMWLAKANTTDVMSYAQAEVEFKRACEKIQADVLHALLTESKEPAFPDGKAEIVVEIKVTMLQELSCHKGCALLVGMNSVPGNDA